MSCEGIFCGGFLLEEMVNQFDSIEVEMLARIDEQFPDENNSWSEEFPQEHFPF
jgi:hypothetical protein